MLKVIKAASALLSVAAFGLGCGAEDFTAVESQEAFVSETQQLSEGEETTAEPASEPTAFQPVPRCTNPVDLCRRLCRRDLFNDHCLETCINGSCGSEFPDLTR